MLCTVTLTIINFSHPDYLELDTGAGSIEVHEGEQTTLEEQNSSLAAGSCIELCCSAGSEISQPTNPLILKKTEGCCRSGKNARNRSFLPSWYKQFPWIHLLYEIQSILLLL